MTTTCVTGSRTPSSSTRTTQLMRLRLLLKKCLCRMVARTERSALDAVSLAYCQLVAYKRGRVQGEARG